jgi:hypothetical protein
MPVHVGTITRILRSKARRAAVALILVAAASLPFAGQAAAGSLVEPQPFLAQYGLVAAEAPVTFVPATQLYDILPGSGPNNGYVRTDGAIFVANDLSSVERVRVVLHEFLHVVSARTFVNNCSPGDPLTLCDRPWAVIYEEGPVEAVTADLLPRFWRWHTGKLLRHQRDWWTSLAYQEAQIWRAASALATGQPIKSQEAREWRAAVLTIPPAERPALLQSVGR